MANKKCWCGRKVVKGSKYCAPCTKRQVEYERRENEKYVASLESRYVLHTGFIPQ